MLHRRYFSLWDVSKPDIEAFIEQTNLHHPTIKFTAETFDTETVFLDTVVYKGRRFKEKSILDAKTHFKNRWKPSCARKKRICERRSLENPTKKRLTKTTFEESNSNFN